MNLLMLDLCAGTGSASAAERDRGWGIFTLDNNPSFGCSITTDVRKFHWYSLRQPDLIWCSPPCDEFSREFMPWSKTGQNPDLSIVQACMRIVSEAKPRYWVIENTKGSVHWLSPLLGNPTYIHNPFYLWGIFPDISHVRVKTNKEHLSSSQAVKRAMIPYHLSWALCMAIEQQPELLEV